MTILSAPRLYRDLPPSRAERSGMKERKREAQQGQLRRPRVRSSDSNAFSWIRFARAMKIAIRDEHRCANVL